MLDVIPAHLKNASIKIGHLSLWLIFMPFTKPWLMNMKISYMKSCLKFCNILYSLKYSLGIFRLCISNLVLASGILSEALKLQLLLLSCSWTDWERSLLFMQVWGDESQRCFRSNLEYWKLKTPTGKNLCRIAWSSPLGKIWNNKLRYYRLWSVTIILKIVYFLAPEVTIFKSVFTTLKACKI